MTEPDLHALGFDFPDWQEMVDTIIEAGVPMINDVGPFRVVGLYQDDDGAGVGIVIVESSPPFTVPSLAGIGGHHVKAYQLYPSLAVLEFYRDGDDEPYNRLLATVNDPHMYPVRGLDEGYEEATEIEYEDYQLSGVAIDVQVYPSEEAWEREQTPLNVSDSPVPGMPTEVFLGPRFVTSPWLFSIAEDEEKIEEANSSAMFMGVVSQATLKKNPLTGQKWWRCEVDCGFPTVVALPGDTKPAPKPGSVIDGNVFLLGSTGFWNR